MNQAPQTPNFGSFGTAGQAATPPYAQPRMNVPPAVPRVPPVDNGIQWGKVIKGVAKVTTIVVVAAVASVALYSVAAAIFTPAAVNSVLAMGINYLGIGLTYLAQGVGAVLGTIGGAIAHVASSLGFGAMGTSGVSAASVASGAALAGGAVVVAASTPAATHIINDLGSHQSLLATKTAAANHLTSHASHVATDMAHHAGEHTSRKFAEQYASQRQPGSFTDRINAGRTTNTGGHIPSPRDSSFAAQLNADRAALDTELKK